jgi:hydroxycarboxylate dehydrogenase B
VVDPRKLGTQESFESEAQAFVEWLRQSPPAPDSEGVLLAGEPERQARRRRETDGIVLDDQTWAEIVSAGAKVGARVG